VGCDTEEEINLVRELLTRHGAKETERINGVKL